MESSVFRTVFGVNFSGSDTKALETWRLENFTKFHDAFGRENGEQLHSVLLQGGCSDDVNRGSKHKSRDLKVRFELPEAAISKVLRFELRDFKSLARLRFGAHAHE